MNHNWKENRFVLFAVFLYTAFYTLLDPKPALRIISLYERGLMAKAMAEAMDDLDK